MRAFNGRVWSAIASYRDERTFGQGFPFDENLAANDGTRRELLEEDTTARLLRWKYLLSLRPQEHRSIEPTPRTARAAGKLPF
jgi:hypothetical protein